MYGMVNQAVRGLVLDVFGADAWRDISQKAESPEEFASLESYDDEVTYNLVSAASEVLALSPVDVLQSFGKYWIHHIASKHYADLMSKTGTSFERFVSNLDHMHSRIQATFPDYKPPSFRVKTLEAGLLQVDYYSERVGLLPFVEGLFMGLGEYFEMTLRIEHVPDEAHPMPCQRMKIQFEECI